jgi:tRNA(Ile)-lysidine synthase
MSQNSSANVRVIHVHHGLQKEADDWVIHCQKTCDDLKLPLKIVHLNLKINKGESVEEMARKGRYEAFKLALEPGEVLLTAQHQDDQAETLLLQLFRGAGVAGLASMPLVSDFGAGLLVRPLLAESRETLEAYSKQHQLDYIDDPSNQDLSFDRNFLRQQIFPQLKERWAGLDKAISRAARIQAETKALLAEFTEQDLAKIQSNKDNTLSIGALLKLSKPRQKLLIRRWIVKSSFSVPSEKKLSHIFSDLINARDDAQPLVEWQGVQIRRFKDKLYIMSPLSAHDSAQHIFWDGQQPLAIASLGLTLAPEILQEIGHPVTVRFRQGGEKIFIAGRSVNISLKNLFQEAEIPPWQRSRLPLIYKKEALVKIIGLE